MMAHANIFVSDTHVASDYGLCPPGMLINTEGSRLDHNPYQSYLWECWQHVQGVWLPSVVGSLPRILWLVGDIVDGMQPKSPVCTDDMLLQVAAAEQALAPLAKTCGRVYAAAGTVFHSGKSATWDNEVARRLGAVPDANKSEGDTSRYARWRLYPVAVDGVVFNVAHKVRGSYVQSSRMTPLVNERITAAVDYFESGWPKPDWIIRAHAHLYRYAPFNVVQVLTLPGWQAKTPHAWGVETGNPFDIGMVVIITEDGRSEHHIKLYKWPQPKMEVVGEWTQENQSRVSALSNTKPILTGSSPRSRSNGKAERKRSCQF